MCCRLWPPCILRALLILGHVAMSKPQSYAQIELAAYIDHTLLIPWATPEQVGQWCDEADRHNFAAVCIAPCHVAQTVELMHHKKPAICTVIGFPTGAQTSAVKLYEAQEAANNGATELDVVINLGWVKMGEADRINREIASIREATGLVIKAILEMAVLSDPEKRLAADVCLDAGVQFLKTSTGWQGGATIDDVRLLQQITRDRVGIKAAGGIRTVQHAYDLILAGATRLGTSHSLALLEQAKQFNV
jgi:deoxyribose-phosphate aldolase